MSAAPERIVGIGASAGGLDAFRLFFQNMPPDSGMAFIMVLHLPSDRKSMLPEILRRWTSMPVVEATGMEELRANTVYVPPPHAAVTLLDGRLQIQIAPFDAPRDYRPIDGFFGSLAEVAADRAIGIILSGTGSDGALGLKAINARGGLTIAQGSDGSGPQYNDMPAGAIATGAVDLIASVEDIPGHLIRLRVAANESAAALDAEAATRVRLSICAILRNQLGHDFSRYREQTFMRRVHRRMQVLAIDTLGGYLSRIEDDRTEAVLLFRDLLISVTSFFRDAAAFEALERLVMPRLFEGRHADGAVRVWVPGCATGEEAYSLAILLAEQMDGVRGPPKVQIFATDIDEHAVATARLGKYPAALLEGLSQQRRERFFNRSTTGYVVAKEIRDLCTFSPHSVVRDPPFSRIDLVSCRNLLIYMTPELQATVMPAFHYSLVPGGILLLGLSETTSRHEELFEPLDKAARIFRRRDGPSRSLNLPPRTEGRNAEPPAPVHRALPPQGPNDAAIAAGFYPVRRLSHRGLAAGAPEQPAPRRMSGVANSFRALLERLGLPRSDDAELLLELEAERRQLKATRSQLEALNEEHQGALEELRSANEELHSVNEELQSTNEELETSKEELQSVNEELHTVNMQLSENVDELDRSNSDLRNLFDSTEVATIFLDRRLIIRSFTPAVGTIYNLIPSDLGRPLTDISTRLEYDGLMEDVREVLDRLTPLERRVSRTDQKAHYIMRVLPYRTPDSEVSGTLVTFTDVTSIVDAEQHHRMLVDELNHRVKNMLTVVISMAQQTARRAGSLDNFMDSFLGRVRGLTTSYTLLSNQNWVSVSLRSVIVEETKPYMSNEHENITVTGPEIRLSPAGALAMGMVIHELATNAVKYGALSAVEGKVAIDWRIENRRERELVIEWTETNGPMVERPSRRGFGLTLIERSFGHELSGSASVAFEPGGVRATLRAPAREAVAAEYRVA